MLQRPHLRWNSILGATSYILEWAKDDAEFADPVEVYRGKETYFDGSKFPKLQVLMAEHASFFRVRLKVVFFFVTALGATWSRPRRL